MYALYECRGRMRYWRLFFVLFLLTFTITGCHRRRERTLPPPQAQAPIITTLPPLPPLILHPVVQPIPIPPPPPPQPVKLKEKQPERIRHRRVARKPTPDTTEPASHPSSSAGGAGAAPGQPAGNSTLVGKLSADDSSTNPDQTAQTQNLIKYTEDLLKKVSPQQQEQHKDTVAQIGSFLAQARQALSTNDQVGAQTLANKARILVDELLK